MAKKKINYDEFDCNIDPQKLLFLRINAGFSQQQLADKTSCFDKNAMTLLEKGEKVKRMNFGAAKMVAEALGVHYTKFVTLAPNQMSQQTKYCIKTMKKMTKPSVVVPAKESFTVPEMSDAMPVAVIFKDKAGREFKYVLESSDVA